MGMMRYEAIRVGAVSGARFLVLAALVPVCAAQTAPATQTPDAGAAIGKASSAGPVSTSTEPGEMVDRVIAIVNGDLILESDVDEERRFAAFQPFSEPASTFSRDKAIQRLINRALILQQAKLQVTDEVKAVDVTTQIATLRKDIPDCRQEKCETDEGWNQFLAKQGFTPAEFQQRWKERMQVLVYIENRFRMGIRIEPAEIKDYYEKVMLPEYRKQKATPPKLEDISSRIQEILLEDLPFAPIFAYEVPVGIHDRVKNYAANPYTACNSWNNAEWQAT